MTKLEFTNKTVDNLNESTTDNGKVDFMKFIDLTNKQYEAITVTPCCTEFICHSCNEKKSGQNDDQLHEVCKECFSGI